MIAINRRRWWVRWFHLVLRCCGVSVKFTIKDLGDPVPTSKISEMLTGLWEAGEPNKNLEEMREYLQVQIESNG